MSDFRPLPPRVKASTLAFLAGALAGYNRAGTPGLKYPLAQAGLSGAKLGTLEGLAISSPLLLGAGHNPELAAKLFAASSLSSTALGGAGGVVGGWYRGRNLPLPKPLTTEYWKGKLPFGKSPPQLPKTSVVRPQVKAYRRIYQALAEGNHGWHGTPAGNASYVLQERKLRGTGADYLAQMAQDSIPRDQWPRGGYPRVRKLFVAYGAPSPAYSQMTPSSNSAVFQIPANTLPASTKGNTFDARDNGGLTQALSAQGQVRYLHRAEEVAHSDGYRSVVGETSPDWISVPGDVPIQPKSLAILPHTQNFPLNSQLQRDSRVRVIPQEAFLRATEKLHGAPMARAYQLETPAAPVTRPFQFRVAPPA